MYKNVHYLQKHVAYFYTCVIISNVVLSMHMWVTDQLKKILAKVLFCMFMDKD